MADHHLNDLLGLPTPYQCSNSCHHPVIIRQITRLYADQYQQFSGCCLYEAPEIPPPLRASLSAYVTMCWSQLLIHVPLFVTPWTVAHQAPLSMEFPKQEYWSGLPFPSPGHLPDPGTKPSSLESPALAGGFLTRSATWEALMLP